MNEAALRVAGWLLIDASLYLLLLAMSAAAILAVTSRRRASLRYAVACGALLVALLLAAIDTADTFAGARHAAGSTRALSPSAVAVEVQQETWKGRWIGATHRVAPASEGWSGALVARVGPSMPRVASGWLVGVALVIAWHLGGVWRVRRLLRRSRSADSALRDSLDALTGRLGLHCPIRLVESSETRVPMVAGLRRPTIIVPERIIGAIDHRSMESLLVHELAHVCRRDLQVNWAQTLVEALFFFHPGVWWLSRVIRQEREHCCDDIAVRVLQDELLYARALLRLHEARSRWPQDALAATGAAFALRIERLCGRTDVQGSTRMLRAASAVLAGIAAAALLVGLVGREGSLVRIAMSGESQTAASLDVGLVAHYPFDGDARDVSGHGNDGLVQGAILTRDRHGSANAAYDFDGVRAHIVAPVAKALDGTGSVSVSCWVSPRSRGMWESWVAKVGFGGSHSQWRVGLGVAPDEWGFTEYTKTDKGKAWENYWLSGSPLPLGVWSHVVIVLDAPRREVTLYRDGARLALFSSIEPPTASQGQLLIGFQTDDGVYFDGQIDDLRVYTRALTSGDVRALHRRAS